MKIGDLRKIAEARTKGEWKYDWGNWEIETEKGREGICSFGTGTKNDGGSGDPYDGEAIAAVMNHIDLLLDVVDAASSPDLIAFGITGEHITDAMDVLRTALEKLENK